MPRYHHSCSSLLRMLANSAGFMGSGIGRKDQASMIERGGGVGEALASARAAPLACLDNRASMVIIIPPSISREVKGMNRTVISLLWISALPVWGLTFGTITG